MSLGKQGAVQPDLMVTWQDLPRSPGHAFYDRLNDVLGAAGFDRFAEELCAPFYAAVMGRPSIPPGRYFRMLLVGILRSCTTSAFAAAVSRAWCCWPTCS